MASKVEYAVQSPPGKDNSMRLCIMTLLIFFFICLILLLIPLLLKGGSQEKVIHITASPEHAQQLARTAVTKATGHLISKYSQTTTQELPSDKTSTSKSTTTTQRLSTAQNVTLSVSNKTQSDKSNTRTTLRTSTVTVTPAVTLSGQKNFTTSSTFAGQNATEPIPGHVRGNASSTGSTSKTLAATSTSTIAPSSPETTNVSYTIATVISTPQNTSDKTHPSSTSKTLAATTTSTIAPSSLETTNVSYTIATVISMPQNTSDKTHPSSTSKTLAATTTSTIAPSSLETTNVSYTIATVISMPQNTSDKTHPSSTSKLTTFTVTPRTVHLPSTSQTHSISPTMSDETNANASYSNSSSQTPTTLSATSKISPSSTSYTVAASFDKTDSDQSQVDVSLSEATTQVPTVSVTHAEISVSSRILNASTTVTTYNLSQKTSNKSEMSSSSRIQNVSSTLPTHINIPQNSTVQPHTTANNSSPVSQTASDVVTSDATSRTQKTVNSSSTIPAYTKSQNVSDNIQSTTPYTRSTPGSVHGTSTTSSVQAIDSALKTADASKKICATGDCKNLAGRVLVMMNHSADRCEDFYEYACGGLRSNELLLEDDPNWNAMYRIRGELNLFNSDQDSSIMNETEPFYKYYTSCVNYYDQFDETNRLQKAKSLLDSIGRFYGEEEWKTVGPRVLTETILNLIEHHSTPLFDVGLDVDTTDPSKFALTLATIAEQPFIFRTEENNECAPDSSSHDAYDEVDLADVYSSYMQCVKSQERPYIEGLMESVKHLRNMTEEALTFVVQDTEIIRKVWAKAMPNVTVTSYALVSKKFEMKTVTDLKTDFGLIDWQLLFSKLLKRSIPETTMVQVYFYENFKAFFNARMSDKSQRLHNALLAMFARDLHASLVRPARGEDRGEYCLDLADSLMEEFSSALYLSSFPRPQLLDLQENLHTIFRNLRSTLEDRVRGSPVLSDASKRAVIAKLDAMQLATPDIDVASLRRRLAAMNLVLDEENFFENTVTLLKRHRTSLYSEYDKDPHNPEQIWSHFILPHHTVGMSIYSLNTIAVPLGIAARRRDFHLSRLQFLKHAYLGGIVGRLVARHFTTTGVKYHPNGQLKEADPIIDAGDFTVWNDSYFMESSLTWRLADGRNVTLEVDSNLKNLWLDELMADQTGLKLAFETYKRLNLSETDQTLPWLGMNSEELFFLSAAQVFCTKSTVLDNAVTMFEDEHLPSPARVNFFISNSYDDFSDMSCSEGTKMNPNSNLKVVPFPEEQIIDP